MLQCPPCSAAYEWVCVIDSILSFDFLRLEQYQPSKFKVSERRKSFILKAIALLVRFQVV